MDVLTKNHIIFQGPITAIGHYSGKSTTEKNGLKTLLPSASGGLAFYATISSLVTTGSAIIRIRINHSPDGATFFPFASFETIAAAGTFIILPEGFVSSAVFGLVEVEVLEKTNVTSFALKVGARCSAG